MVLITAERIVQLCLLIIAGITVYRCGLVKHEHMPSVNAILMNLALPAVTLTSFQSELIFNGKGELLPILGISVLIQCMSLLLGFIFIRNHPYANIERASMAFTNNAFIAIPLLTAVFGEIGTFYASTFNAISSLPFYTVLPIMITGQGNLKDNLKQLLNVNVFMCILAVVLLLADIHVPEFILTPLGWLSNMTTPLAMVVIGCVIANSDFSHMINPRTVFLTLLRLIVIPAIICVVLYFLLHDNQTMLLCFCVLAATPTGSLVTIYTEQADSNTALSSGIFMLTTFLSAVTIPIIVLLVEML